MPMSGALPGFAGDVVRCHPGALSPRTDRYICRIENKMRKNGWVRLRKALTTNGEHTIVRDRDEGLYFLPPNTLLTFLSDAGYGPQVYALGCEPTQWFYINDMSVCGCTAFHTWIRQGDAQCLHCDPSRAQGFFVLPSDTWDALRREITEARFRL